MAYILSDNENWWSNSTDDKLKLGQWIFVSGNQHRCLYINA